MEFVVKFIAVILSMLVIASCASSPDEIATASVSTIQYKNYSCEQVSMELDRVQTRVNQLHGTLKKKSDNVNAQMAVGMILFWPALFFLEGGDGPQAQEYARLKGEAEALQKVSTRKTCELS